MGDSDARGHTHAQYEAEFVTAGGDPNHKRHKTHGHHIVFEEALGALGKAASREAKDVLLYYGLDPYYGRENLAYAPNQGHSDATLDFIRTQLVNIHTNTLLTSDQRKTAIITRLKELARDYTYSKLPSVIDYKST